MRMETLLFDLYEAKAGELLIQECMRIGIAKMLSVTYAMALTDGDILGKEFSNGHRWGCILKEMSSPGYNYRVQWFRAGGFDSHESYRTLDEACNDLFDADCWVADFGALDRLSKTVEWRIGSFALGLMSQINRGDITLDEGHRLLTNRRKEIFAA